MVKFIPIIFQTVDSNDNKIETKVNQSFYMNDESDPILINPLYDTSSKQGKAKFEETISQIN